MELIAKYIDITILDYCRNQGYNSFIIEVPPEDLHSNYYLVGNSKIARAYCVKPCKYTDSELLQYCKTTKDFYLQGGLIYSDKEKSIDEFALNVLIQTGIPCKYAIYMDGNGRYYKFVELSTMKELCAWNHKHD